MGCLFTDLPIDAPLWVLIDIYGSTQSVQFVIEGDYPMQVYMLHNSELNNTRMMTRLL